LAEIFRERFAQCGFTDESELDEILAERLAVALLFG